LTDPIPYPLPPRGPLREVHNCLQNDHLSAQNANHLLAAGIDWSLVAPHVADLDWWQEQPLAQSEPPKLNWEIKSWGGATLRIAVEDTVIWVDPGPKAPLPVPDPELVLITHAHSDHISELGKWASKYPSARIVMTKASAELLELRAAYDAGLQACLDRTVRVDFDQPRTINGVQLKFLPASHLYGAAMIEIGYGPDKILVTGDFALREVGGLPGAVIPTSAYNILVMGVSEASPNSSPFADLEATHQRLLQSVSAALAENKGPLLIPAQAFGQAQEIYTALVMAQRAGAFPDKVVSLKDFSATVSGLYERILSKSSGPWSVPFIKTGATVSEDALIILPEKDSWVNDKIYPGLKLFIDTHAGWGEQMAFAVRTATSQMYTYHGFNTAFAIALDHIGRKVNLPVMEL